MPKLASFRVKLVNFLSEKGRSSFLLRSLHFGSNRLKKSKNKRKSVLTRPVAREGAFGTFALLFN